MAPAIDESVQALPTHIKGQASYPKPLKLTGALDKFTYDDTTPTIGREFPSINIVDDLLNAENADELIRDLAITSEFWLDNYETDFPTICLHNDTDF